MAAHAHLRYFCALGAGGLAIATLMAACNRAGPQPTTHGAVSSQDAPDPSGGPPGWTLVEADGRDYLYLEELDFALPYPQGLVWSQDIQRSMCVDDAGEALPQCIVLSDAASTRMVAIRLMAAPDASASRLSRMHASALEEVPEGVVVEHEQITDSPDEGPVSQLWLSHRDGSGVVFEEMSFFVTRQGSAYFLAIMEAAPAMDQLTVQHGATELPPLPETGAQIHVERLVVGEVETNCYVLWESSSKAAAVIDPGAEAERIFDFAKAQKLSVKAIVQTHNHWDHTGGSAELQRLTGAPVFRHVKRAAAGPEVERPAEERHLKHGQKLSLGQLSFEVLHTPGHEQGSLCLHGEGVLFTGDLLFKGTVGRTDTVGGDRQALLHSLRQVLAKVPDETLVLPGHFGHSTMGVERRTNPFFALP